ncbi:MAG: pyridoxamine 5'-phosphate oxidase family protein [Acutalibacter sp.]|nr:pyridoxamine 5'-phosphate oxidase family protein [Acutalibacter sp.]
MRAMRRTDRKLSAGETEEILVKGEYGVLSTVCEDGTPYGVPISYAYSASGRVIYMHCSADGGQKIDNLRLSGKACLTVVSDTELMPEKFATKYWSAMVLGTVQIIEDKEEKQEGIEAVLRKYAPMFEEKGLKYIENSIDKIHILKLRVETAEGKARKR